MENGAPSQPPMSRFCEDIPGELECGNPAGRAYDVVCQEKISEKQGLGALRRGDWSRL